MSGTAVGLDGAGRPVLIPHDENGSDATASGDVNLALLEATMVRPVTPAPIAPTKPTQAAKAVPARAPKASDIVRDLQARLRVVNAEIKARKKLEDEREQIQRLLTAAKTKPATVRPLRSAG